MCECRVCTASADGHLCVWDSDSVLRLSRIQLDIEDQSVSSLVHHQQTFLCCKSSYAAVLASRAGWLRGPAVEHRSLAGVLSLSCARLAADG